MNLRKGNQIVSDFRTMISEKSGFAVKSSTISRNVLELNGTINHLLYLKARSAYPLRWGITANVVEKLKKQVKPWAVVLLYLEPNIGYFLSSDEIEYYIKNVWPLGNDGDFKPSPGSYLANNNPFRTIDEFLDQLQKKKIPDERRVKCSKGAK